jgi:molybdate transport system substrate-binding protein
MGTWRTSGICLSLLVLGIMLTLPASADRTLTVFGAASLTEYLDSLGPIFEKSHPDVTVRINTAGTGQLRVQIEQGAPADVFMSADTQNMDTLLAAGRVSKPSVFARNRLTVIIPKDNPAGIQSLADLAKPKIKLVIGAADVPVGKYTQTVIQKMDASGAYGKDFARRVLANVRSEEPSVKSVVTKVSLGEADAGFCYISDVTPVVRPKVRALRIPDTDNVIAVYPMAVLTDSKQKDLGDEFVKLVLSAQGQRLLAKHGFLTLSPPRNKQG